MAAAVFLPRVNGPIHAREKNMLIESGNSWLFIVFAVLITISVYRIHRNAERYRSAAAVFLVAVIATGVALYDRAGNRFATKNVIVVVTGPIAKSPKRATPGIGIYGAGVGGLLTLVGGVWIMGWGYGGKEEGRRFKVCPDCAEKVLADTRVCKHCQHRFA